MREKVLGIKQVVTGSWKIYPQLLGISIDLNDVSNQEFTSHATRILSVWCLVLLDKLHPFQCPTSCFSVVDRYWLILVLTQMNQVATNKLVVWLSCLHFSFKKKQQSLWYFLLVCHVTRHLAFGQWCSSVIHVCYCYHHFVELLSYCELWAVFSIALCSSLCYCVCSQSQA
jgi:hypothetical protein